MFELISTIPTLQIRTKLNFSIELNLYKMKNK